VDVASLLSGIGSLGLGTVLGTWLSARRTRLDARADVIPAVEKVERTRWFSSSTDSIDMVRAAVLELEAAALRGCLPRKPVMLYAALAVASWRISEKDPDHSLWDEWADVVTDARDLVRSLVWRDDVAGRDFQREADFLFHRAQAVTRRTVKVVWAESPDLRAYERTYKPAEPAQSGS